MNTYLEAGVEKDFLDSAKEEFKTLKEDYEEA